MTDTAPMDADDICTALRRRIRNLELPPQTRLVEKKLSEEFGASRATIRQALQILAHEGIVSLIANKGAVVSSPTLAEAREIFSVRHVIEKACVRTAAEVISDSEVAALQEMIDLEKKAVEEGRISDALNHSSNFHTEISRITRNNTMHNILVEILGRSSLVCSLYSKANRSPCHFEDHQSILELLQKHDIEAAAEEMEKHLQNLEESLNLEDRAGLVIRT